MFDYQNFVFLAISVSVLPSHTAIPLPVWVQIFSYYWRSSSCFSNIIFRASSP